MTDPHPMWREPPRYADQVPPPLDRWDAVRVVFLLCALLAFAAGAALILKGFG